MDCKIQENSVLNCDCMEFMRGGALNSKVDLIVTDPPYEFKSKDNDFRWKFGDASVLKDIDQNFWMSFDPIELLEYSKKICKKMNWYYFTNKTLLLKYIWRAEENWFVRDLLLRLKSNPIPTNCGHYLIDKEYCVYIHEKGATFNSDLGVKNYFTYEFNPIKAREFDHPTIKPLNMIKRIINISSKEEDLIFDPYLWSGTTAVACEELKRKYIGCEINPKYCEIAKQRIKNSEMKKSLF